MIEFKDITVEDKDTITSFTMNSCRRNCDLSFSNLCSWRFMYNTKFAVIDNFLVFKFWLHGRVSYMMPVGQGDPEKELIEKLIEDSQLEGEPLPLENDLADAIDPGRFLIKTARQTSLEIDNNT